MVAPTILRLPITPYHSIPVTHKRLNRSPVVLPIQEHVEVAPSMPVLLPDPSRKRGPHDRIVSPTLFTSHVFPHSNL